MTINTADIKVGMTLGFTDAVLLRDHIDAQAARIAELEEEAGHYKERYWVSQRELAAQVDSLKPQLSIAAERAGINFDRAEAAEKLAEFRGQNLLSVNELIADRDKRIAEQQAVIDQRNGECDRLINELAALREQKTQPAPVAVPYDCIKSIAEKVQGICARTPGSTFYNAAEFTIDEVLRLNSGSKPFVVRGLVNAYDDGNGTEWLLKDSVYSAIRDAGGEIAE